MILTSMNDVSAALQRLSSVPEIQRKTDNASPQEAFQKVLERQTDASAAVQGKTRQKPKAKDTSPKEAVQDKPEKDAESKDCGKTDEETVEKFGDAEKGKDIPKDAKAERDDADASLIPPETLEALLTAAGAVINRIAVTLNVSADEVVAAMKDLGMMPMEVLKQNALGDLTLRLMGENDSLALLTDDAMYKSFEKLADAQREVLEQAAAKLAVSGKEMTEIIALPNTYGMAKDSAEEFWTALLVQQVSGEQEPAEQQQLSAFETVAGNESKADTREGDTDTKPVLENRSLEAILASKEEVTNWHEGSPKHSEEGQQGKEEQGSSFLLQQPVVQQGSYQPQSIGDSQPMMDQETQNIMRQIMDYMRVSVKPDMSSLEMQLHPASLGTLQVQVASKGGVVTAQFIAQNDGVKAALESQMVELKESFAQQGVKVEAIEVSVQTNEFNRNLDSSEDRQSKGDARRNRTRRIRLEGELNPEDMQSLEEADRITADMMAANGNTVDYTA